MTVDTRYNMCPVDFDGVPGTVKPIAAETWNTYIAPPLHEALDNAKSSRANENMDPVFGDITRASLRALFVFFDRRVIGNPAAASELGEELRRRLAIKRQFVCLSSGVRPRLPCLL